MKHFIPAVLVSSMLFIACSKDDNGSASTPLATEPEANEAFDNSNFGIYKGVIADPAAVVVVDMSNDGQTEALVRINGEDFFFTSAQPVTEGTGISAMTFTSGDMSFDFYVNGNGTNAYIADAVFPGHDNTTIQIVKEYSDSQVICYDGGYAGNGSGEVEFILQDDLVRGLTRASGEPDVYYLDGVLSGNSLTGIFDVGEFSGNRNGNTITGTIDNTENGNGNYTAQRHL